MVTLSYNPSTLEAEKGIVPDVQSQPGVHRKFQVSLDYRCENPGQEKKNLYCVVKHSIHDCIGAMQHCMHGVNTHSQCSSQSQKLPFFRNPTLADASFHLVLLKIHMVKKHSYSIDYLYHPGIRVRIWEYTADWSGEAAHWRPVPEQLLQKE